MTGIETFLGTNYERVLEELRVFFRYLRYLQIKWETWDLAKIPQTDPVIEYQFQIVTIALI